MNYGPHLPSKHRSQAGFTLIELMVGLTILILMTGLGIAALIRQQDRQTSLQTARSIQNMMRVARAKAQAKETPCTAGENLIAVQVGFAAGSTRIIELQGVCTNGITSFSTTPTYTLPANISGVTDLGTIQFNTLSGGTNLASDRTVIIDSITETDFSFTVGSRGRIDEGNFCTVPSGGGSCTPL